MQSTHSNFHFLLDLDQELSKMGQLAGSYSEGDRMPNLAKLRQSCKRHTQNQVAQVASIIGAFYWRQHSALNHYAASTDILSMERKINA